MSDAALFVLLFTGLLVIRVAIATFIFLCLLPKTDRCPNCDTPTVRIASVLFDRLTPWFRKSWCMNCDWTGLLRRGNLSETLVIRDSVIKR